MQPAHHFKDFDASSRVNQLIKCSLFLLQVFLLVRAEPEAAAVAELRVVAVEAVLVEVMAAAHHLLVVALLDLLIPICG